MDKYGLEGDVCRFYVVTNVVDGVLSSDFVDGRQVLVSCRIRGAVVVGEVGVGGRVGGWVGSVAWCHRSYIY